MSLHTLQIYMWFFPARLVNSMCICAGVFACNNIKKTGDAVKDEERGVVDEEEAFTSRV